VCVCVCVCFVWNPGPLHRCEPEHAHTLACTRHSLGGAGVWANLALRRSVLAGSCTQNDAQSMRVGVCALPG